MTKVAEKNERVIGRRLDKRGERIKTNRELLNSKAKQTLHMVWENMKNVTLSKAQSGWSIFRIN